MDGTQFDDLSRTLARGISRRSAIKALAGGLLGALGIRGAAEAQVSQIQCGNVMCATNIGICAPGCVCCVYTNPITRTVINSRCRPPGTCSPAETRCPPDRPVYDPVRGCLCTSATSCPQPAASTCRVATCANGVCSTALAASNAPCGTGKICCAGQVCTQVGTSTNCSGCGDVCDGVGETCGGGGQAGVCGCTDNGTACGAAVCGTKVNNCGQTVSCGPRNGSCPAGQICGSGACSCPAGTCGDGCTKSICADQSCKQAANTVCVADGDCCSNVCVEGVCLGGCVAESGVCDSSTDCCGSSPCTPSGGDQFCCASGKACGTTCCSADATVCSPSGTCVQCLTATDCPTPEDPCQIAVCSSDNTCSTVTATNDTPCGDKRICCGGNCLSSTRESTCGSCENQCRGDASFCSEDGICVGCLEDSHCPGNRPICTPAGACVECYNNDHCPGDDRPYCSERQTCGQCGTVEHCPQSTTFCRPMACSPEGWCGEVPVRDNTVCNFSGIEDGFCCNGRCGYALDPNNCLGCGITCADGEFCVAGTGCSKCQQASDCPQPSAAECQGIAACTGGVCTYAPAAADTVCRAATGPCGVDVTCDGNTECPADRFVAEGTPCREPACGSLAVCTGDSAVCPPSAPKPYLTLCNAPTNPCRAPTYCNGVDAGDCPPSYDRPDGTPCSIGECIDGICRECTGAAASCESNNFPCCGGRECIDTGIFGRICV